MPLPEVFGEIEEANINDQEIIDGVYGQQLRANIVNQMRD